MTLKLSYSDSPQVKTAVFELLETTFPGIGVGATAARALGGVWEDVSTPFVAFEDGRAVSHVGRIDLPLIVMGKPVTVGTIHAVATRPDCRGRGLYRRVMEDVLADSAGRYETLILTTEHPEYYTSFGFRRLEETGFAVKCRTGGAGGLRRLDVTSREDVALLQRLLDQRAPVSEVVGVAPERAIFCFNEGRRPLQYATGLDAVLCYEQEGNRLTLFDIVGPKIPSFSEMIPVLPGGVEEIVFAFSPDRVGVEGGGGAVTQRPWLFEHDGPSYLMVRGPFAAEGRTFTLPRSART